MVKKKDETGGEDYRTDVEEMNKQRALIAREMALRKMKGAAASEIPSFTKRESFRKEAPLRDANGFVYYPASPSESRAEMGMLSNAIVGRGTPYSTTSALSSTDAPRKNKDAVRSYIQEGFAAEPDYDMAGEDAWGKMPSNALPTKITLPFSQGDKNMWGEIVTQGGDDTAEELTRDLTKVMMSKYSPNHRGRMNVREAMNSDSSLKDRTELLGAQSEDGATFMQGGVPTTIGEGGFSSLLHPNDAEGNARQEAQFQLMRMIQAKSRRDRLAGAGNKKTSMLYDGGDDGDVAYSEER